MSIQHYADPHAHETLPPQPSSAVPHWILSDAHVAGVHPTQMPATQTSPDGHTPHWIGLPVQLSVPVPQLSPWRTHSDGGGGYWQIPWMQVRPIVH